MFPMVTTMLMVLFHKGILSVLDWLNHCLILLAFRWICFCSILLARFILSCTRPQLSVSVYFIHGSFHYCLVETLFHELKFHSLWNPDLFEGKQWPLQIRLNTTQLTWIHTTNWGQRWRLLVGPNECLSSVTK
jgi:hypothetical protein